MSHAGAGTLRRSSARSACSSVSSAQSPNMYAVSCPGAERVRVRVRDRVRVRAKVRVRARAKVRVRVGERQ